MIMYYNRTKCIINIINTYRPDNKVTYLPSSKHCASATMYNRAEEGIYCYKRKFAYDFSSFKKYHRSFMRILGQDYAAVQPAA